MTAFWKLHGARCGLAISEALMDNLMDARNCLRNELSIMMADYDFNKFDWYCLNASRDVLTRTITKLHRKGESALASIRALRKTSREADQHWAQLEIEMDAIEAKKAKLKTVKRNHAAALVEAQEATELVAKAGRAFAKLKREHGLDDAWTPCSHSG